MAQTPEERRASAKRTRLWTLYRITPEEQAAVEQYQHRSKYFSILLERGNPKDKTPALLFNDHDHDSGLFRGRLSYLINKALGTFESSYKARTPIVLRALADYLENPPAVAAIGPHYGMIGRAKLNKKKKVYGSPNGPIKAQKKGKA